MAAKKSVSFGVTIKRALSCLDWATLVVIPVIAMLMNLTTMSPFPGPLVVINMLLYIAVWTLFLGYGLSAVHGISDGVKEVGIGSEYRADYSVGFHGLVILVPAAGLVYLTRGIEPFLFRLLIDAVLLCWLPASVLVLARTRSWVAAFNPLHITRVIVSLGADYWKVLLVSDVLIGLVLSMAGKVDRTVFHISLMLVLLGSFALLGAAAYARRDQLGQQSRGTETLGEIDENEQQPDENEFVRQSKIIEREQGPVAAAEFLGTELKQLFAPPPAHEYLLRLLQRAGHTDAMLEQGREMIQRYLENDNGDAALNVARECLEVQSRFCLQRLERDDELIEIAIRRGRNDLVVKLCISFIHQFGRYGRSVDHTITAAGILSERYSEPQRARALLQDAIKRGAEGERLKTVQAMIEALG